jgi:hypothetical protein
MFFKIFLPIHFTLARNSVEKLSPPSPRLPNINNSNKTKELSSSSDESDSGHINPLSLSYSQLYQHKKSSQTKKNSQTRHSIDPLTRDKRSSVSLVNTDISTSSDSTLSSSYHQQSSNDKYIRLHTSQLRRLHVSNKYMKEAKKLYFNATLRVFVPRHSIIQIS